MAKITQQQAIMKALTARGYVRAPQRDTSKYFAYRRPEWTHNHVFVGKAGAVRQGPVASKSTPISSKVRADLIAEGRGK